MPKHQIDEIVSILGKPTTVKPAVSQILLVIGIRPGTFTSSFMESIRNEAVRLCQDRSFVVNWIIGFTKTSQLWSVIKCVRVILFMAVVEALAVVTGVSRRSESSDSSVETDKPLFDHNAIKRLENILASAVSASPEVPPFHEPDSVEQSDVQAGLDSTAPVSETREVSEPDQTAGKPVSGTVKQGRRLRSGAANRRVSSNV